MGKDGAGEKKYAAGTADADQEKGEEGGEGGPGKADTNDGGNPQ